MRSALLSLSLLLLLLPSAFPQEEEDGQVVDPIQTCLELLKSQSDADFEQAMTILTDQAQKNDDSALFLLGSIYEVYPLCSKRIHPQTGKKVPRNFKKAMEYFNASAELGNADAMQSLGFMWGTGKGVTINKPLVTLFIPSQTSHCFTTLLLHKGKALRRLSLWVTSIFTATTFLNRVQKLQLDMSMLLLKV